MFIADLHIHSKYSRATARNMDLDNLAYWAKLKGINLLGTGDFTHHLWLQELKNKLTPADKGLFSYKGIYFMLTVEVSNIFSQKGKGYRIHNVVAAPSFEIVDEINKMLSGYGNLAADGRPIVSLSCYELAKELFNISSDIMLIPAHIWTPWFGLFGSNSGFNSLEEAFGEYSERVTALETGLSSDPPMNWRLSALDRFSLVSNSDSHSPSKIGREANLFSCQMGYYQIKEALEKKDKEKFLGTVEFFPQEGKYHYDGHRNCKIRLHPQETKKHKGICPVCGRPLTKGVLYRVGELADRSDETPPPSAPPFTSMVPLVEIIAASKGLDKTSKVAGRQYLDLVNSAGTEMDILLQFSREQLFKALPSKIAEGIIKVRERNVEILPGYDGEYGKINIFSSTKEEGKEQLTLF